MKHLRPEACDFERVEPLPRLEVPQSRAACQHLARPYPDTDRCSVPPLSNRQQTSPILQGPIAGGGGGGGGTPVSLTLPPCTPQTPFTSGLTINPAISSHASAPMVNILAANVALDSLRIRLDDLSGGALGGVIVARIAIGFSPPPAGVPPQGTTVATSPPINPAGAAGLITFPMAGNLIAGNSYRWELDFTGMTGATVELGTSGPASACEMFLFPPGFPFIWSASGRDPNFELWGVM